MMKRQNLASLLTNKTKTISKSSAKENQKVKPLAKKMIYNRFASKEVKGENQDKTQESNEEKPKEDQ